MRVLPSGSTALLLELDNLEQVLGLYDALSKEPPHGVVDIVPAARTVLLVADVRVTSLSALEVAVRRTAPSDGSRRPGKLIEVAVHYDGEDIAIAADLLDCDVPELVRRHTTDEWTVAFCGFAPGFGYLTSQAWPFDVPRRASPRTRVPPGSLALAGEFSGVYPRASPGGWQLIGRVEVEVFDPRRDPAALLQPGMRVRFVDLAAR